ncbi:hypothetical protein AAFF_G00154280 [Aldrovandia affinis]|uniref:Uncharacterized protein n=1 Tax=Aldrovandia affinis TaxID=143900 RepID=A0AAD7T019_9TELE|nr:hypothetical protein AAFF_G00154280 [Aldrovandia affinis]
MTASLQSDPLIVLGDGCSGRSALQRAMRCLSHSEPHQSEQASEHGGRGATAADIYVQGWFFGEWAGGGPGPDGYTLTVITLAEMAGSGDGVEVRTAKEARTDLADRGQVKRGAGVASCILGSPF